MPPNSGGLTLENVLLAHASASNGNLPTSLGHLLLISLSTAMGIHAYVAVLTASFGLAWVIMHVRVTFPFLRSPSRRRNMYVLVRTVLILTHYTTREICLALHGAPEMFSLLPGPLGNRTLLYLLAISSY